MRLVEGAWVREGEVRPSMFTSVSDVMGRRTSRPPIGSRSRLSPALKNIPLCDWPEPRATNTVPPNLSPAPIGSRLALGVTTVPFQSPSLAEGRAGVARTSLTSVIAVYKEKLVVRFDQVHVSALPPCLN